MQRKLTPTLSQAAPLYRWQLSFVASEWYQGQVNERQYALLWELLQQTGLHPLTPVDWDLVPPCLLEEVKSTWRAMYAKQEQEGREKVLSKKRKTKRA